MFCSTNVLVWWLVFSAFPRVCCDGCVSFLSWMSIKSWRLLDSSSNICNVCAKEKMPGDEGVRWITDWNWNAVVRRRRGRSETVAAARLTPDILQPGRQRDLARIRPAGPFWLPDTFIPTGVSDMWHGLDKLFFLTLPSYWHIIDSVCFLIDVFWVSLCAEDAWFKGLWASSEDNTIESLAPSRLNDVQKEKPPSSSNRGGAARQTVNPTPAEDQHPAVPAFKSILMFSWTFPLSSCLCLFLHQKLD